MTRSKAFSIALSVLFLSLVTIPTASAVEVRSGIKVGAVSAEITDSGLDSGTGLSVGGFVMFPLSGLFGLQGEALYSQKGAKDLVIHYLEFPALARVNLSLGGLSLFGLGGISFGFEQSCLDCFFSLKNPDLEGVMGAGLEFGLGKWLLGLEGRYFTSLSDLNQATTPPVSELSIKNQGIGVYLGLSRRFGGEEEIPSDEIDLDEP